MVTSSNINLCNIHPYGGSQHKSFEQMCYQLFKRSYNSKGVFVPINDDGGGDGIEFYLELPNGDIWGWQCKYFSRVGSSQKQQIKKSLSRAYHVHGTCLKKWTLCSLSDLTTNERSWFENDLASSVYGGSRVLPIGHSVELLHVGDSDILDMLSENQDIATFYFGTLYLNQKWFLDKYDLLTSGQWIEKYDKELHTTIRTQYDLYNYIGGSLLLENIRRSYDDFGFAEMIVEYRNSIEAFKTYRPTANFLNLYEQMSAALSSGSYIVEDAIAYVINCSREKLGTDSISCSKKIASEKYSSFTLFCSEIERIVEDCTVFDEMYALPYLEREQCKKAYDAICGPKDVLHNNYSAICQFLLILSKAEDPCVHIHGSASKGKTHLSLNVLDACRVGGIPALFLSGQWFTTGDPVEKQILNICDIPNHYSFSEFLFCLNEFGRANNSRVVLIIDGLNESIHWNLIWKNGIESLQSQIQSFPSILLITTFRSTYMEELFPSHYFDLVMIKK